MERLHEVEKLFKEYFKPLCGFAVKYVADLDDAKNIVHEVFVSLWEKWGSFESDTNYRAYLYTAVRNRCHNHLRDRKTTVGIEAITHQAADPGQELETKELQQEIDFAIQTLPEKCRMIFEMSRFEGLKYTEIADRMGISVKTVEAQMTKALSLLRDQLGKFMLVIFSWLMI